VPFTNSSQPQLLALYGLNTDLALDSAIELILATLLEATENLSKPRPIEYIEPAIYNAVKRKFGYVSDEMYNRQFFLFNQRLEKMTVYFEPIIFLSPDKPRIFGVG
jgi:hypothetical protein